MSLRRRVCYYFCGMRKHLIPTKPSRNFRPAPLSPKPQKPMQMNWFIARTALVEPTQLAPRRAKNLYGRLDASERRPLVTKLYTTSTPIQPRSSLLFANKSLSPGKQRTRQFEFGTRARNTHLGRTGHFHFAGGF